MKNRSFSWYIPIIELLVVFLGVTSGFVLQNYGDNKKDKMMEENYLEGFRSDVRANMDMLLTQIEDDSTWLAQIDYAIYQVMDNTLSYDSACNLMIGMASFSRFKKQNITYINMINSGNLGLIRNYDLRQEIVAYHKSLDDFDVVEEYFKNYSQTIFIPYMLETMDAFTAKFSSREEAKSLRFRNAFAAIISFKQQRLEGYLELMTESKQIMQILDKQ